MAVGYNGDPSVVWEDFTVRGDYGRRLLGWRALHGIAVHLGSSAVVDFYGINSWRYRAISGAGWLFPLAMRLKKSTELRRGGTRRGSVRGDVMELGSAISSFLKHVKARKALGFNTHSATSGFGAKFRSLPRNGS